MFILFIIQIDVSNWLPTELILHCDCPRENTRFIKLCYYQLCLNFVQEFLPFFGRCHESLKGLENAKSEANLVPGKQVVLVAFFRSYEWY
jgi:hypothetical protein